MSNEVKNTKVEGQPKEEAKKAERWYITKIKGINKLLKDGKTKDGKELDEKTRSFLMGKLDAFREMDRVETKLKMKEKGKEWIPYDKYKEAKKAEAEKAKAESKEATKDVEEIGDDDIPF